jgi:hypothetical protein
MAGSVALYEIWRQRGWAMPSEPSVEAELDTGLGLDMDSEEDA